MENIVRNEYQRLMVLQNPQLQIDALREMGVEIGHDVIIREGVSIDLTRPSLIHIGSYVYLHRNLKILTHDYATRVFLIKYKEFVPSSGKVWIGDNVWFGENVTILKGAYIGNNCIIGLNSVVMDEIPDNSVAVGSPARVVCSLDDYFAKRKNKCEQEAFEYAWSIVHRFDRRPSPEDFWEEFPLFVSGEEIDKYPGIPINHQLAWGDEAFQYYKQTHRAKYRSFDEFIKKAGIK